jgi:hypothetical protein
MKFSYVVFVIGGGEFPKCNTVIPCLAREFPDMRVVSLDFFCPFFSLIFVRLEKGDMLMFVRAPGSNLCFFFLFNVSIFFSSKFSNKKKIKKYFRGS